MWIVCVCMLVCVCVDGVCSCVCGCVYGVPSGVCVCVYGVPSGVCVCVYGVPSGVCVCVCCVRVCVGEVFAKLGSNLWLPICQAANVMLGLFWCHILFGRVCT